MEQTYSTFDSNIDFYNDQRYREANKLFYQATELLMACGMTRNQACHWMSGWGYSEDDGD